MEIKPKLQVRISRNKYNKIAITCLEKVLRRNDISKYYYNLNGYSDDKICLEKKRNRWILYYGSYGEKTNKQVFIDACSASREIINELADNEIDAKKMLRQYNIETKKAIRYQGSLLPIYSVPRTLYFPVDSVQTPYIPTMPKWVLGPNSRLSKRSKERHQKKAQTIIENL